MANISDGSSHMLYRPVLSHGVSPQLPRAGYYVVASSVVQYTPARGQG
jgi:hypothetical protein